MASIVSSTSLSTKEEKPKLILKAFTRRDNFHNTIVQEITAVEHGLMFRCSGEEGVLNSQTAYSISSDLSGRICQFPNPSSELLIKIWYSEFGVLSRE
jgi:hypothetical protein